MRVLLLIILLVPATAAGQDKKAAEDPTLVVVKFSLKRDRRHWGGGPSSSRANDYPVAGDITTQGRTTSRLPGQVSIEEQSGTMRQIERRARRGGAYSVREFYRFKVTLRNTDAKAVRAFYWSFETRQSLLPDDVARREFLCWAKIKPGQARSFETQASKAPSQTVSADTAAGDAAGPDQVVVNRVEYADGSVWQRPGWRHVPVKRPRFGDCVGLPSFERR